MQRSSTPERMVPPNVAEIGPFQLLSKIGEGAMGVVYSARQRRPIRRDVALKIVRPELAATPAADHLIAEHKVLASLGHPNIPRMFDSGRTNDGRPFFAMELVAGDPLTTFCDQNRLSVSDRLRLFVVICGTIQHAHQRGVVHRDLKPANILVALDDGKATPKVVDFGIAQAAGVQGAGFAGMPIGTPAYMSPEQKQNMSVVDRRSDIYSLGVLLHEILARSLPEQTSVSNLEEDSRGDLEWIILKAINLDPAKRHQSALLLMLDLERFLNGEPVSAHERGIAYRLQASARRHRVLVLGGLSLIGALALGSATGTVGAVLAGTIALGLLLTVLAATTVFLRRVAETQQREHRQAEEAFRNGHLALARREAARVARQTLEREQSLAERQKERADRAYDEVMRLANLRRISELEERERSLQQAVLGNLPALEAWLDDARAVTENWTEHEAALESLRAGSTAYRPEDRERDRREDPSRRELKRLTKLVLERTKSIAAVESSLTNHQEPIVRPEDERCPHQLTKPEKVAHLQALEDSRSQLQRDFAACEQGRVEQRATWRFASTQDQWRHDLHSELVQRIRVLRGNDAGHPSIGGVEARIALVEQLAETTVRSQAAARAWTAAIEDIAELPVYAGLRLTPQFGLLPLGRNLESGFWEFWHVQTGERPQPHPDTEAESTWLIGEDTGIVLVLLPGGSCVLGSQPDDPIGPNYYPEGARRDGPPYELELAPFFMSRYLTTQGQWVKATGSNPANGQAPFNVAGKQHDRRHPVEQVSWIACNAVLQRLGLDLPTESQWEYAARAGTTTPWWTGPHKNDLQGAANLSDRFSWHNDPGSSHHADRELFDGYVNTSPVGAFRANPFGLHDVYGNVAEWCRDWLDEYERLTRAPGDGEARTVANRLKIYRGGAFLNRPVAAASSFRSSNSPASRVAMIGVRSSRRLR